jgi:hypothetical protein
METGDHRSVVSSTEGICRSTAWFRLSLDRVWAAGPAAEIKTFRPAVAVDPVKIVILLIRK